MAVTSGFFDSISGDRTYDAGQMSNYFEGLVSDGVFENVGDKMVVTAGTGMTVIVGTGRALIQCRWIKNDSVLTLDISPSNVQLNRIDLIVLRLDLSESGRSITIAVKEGVSSYVPTTPTLTRNSTTYELCLAKIRVNAGVTQILNSYITDMRASDQCGWVTGIIRQVDTAELFLQWQTAYENYYAESTAAFDAYMAKKQAEFETWFGTLTSELRVDTTIKKYQNTVTTEAEVSEINIGISQYETGDILLVHVGGVLFVEGDEFTIDGEGESAKIILTNTLKPDNNVTFIVIKSMAGASSSSVMVELTDAEIDEIIS